MPRQSNIPSTKKPQIKKPLVRTKAQAQALLLKVAPWLIKPSMIRKSIRRSLADHPKGFKDKLDALLVLVDQLYNLEEQENAMNPSPSLLKAQRSGSVKRQLDETARALACAWKALMDEIK